MEKKDIDLVLEVCLKSLQGVPDYEILYQSAINHDLVLMGLKLSTYFKFLIQQYENKIKLKSLEEIE